MQGDLNPVQGDPQFCTNTRNTCIPPGILSFQVEVVDTFKLMEEMILLLFWKNQIQLLVSEGLDLTSSQYM